MMAELQPIDLERIRGSHGWRRNRLEMFDTQTGRVVVKGQRPSRGMLPRRLFNAGVSLVGLATLKLPLRNGGAQAQRVEVRRLAQLQAAGILVPAVLHVDAEFFVQQHLDGPDLSHELARPGADQLALWQRGLAAVCAVHAANECLSQAFARNFIVTAKGVYAIDLEEDPLEMVNLAQAQARDWLFYLQSTLWLMPAHQAAMLALWQNTLQQESRPQADVLLKIARRLAPLRRLPEQRKPWGRDIVSAQAAAAFLNRWARLQAGA